MCTHPWTGQQSRICQCINKVLLLLLLLSFSYGSAKTIWSYIIEILCPLITDDTIDDSIGIYHRNDFVRYLMLRQVSLSDDPRLFTNSLPICCSHSQGLFPACLSILLLSLPGAASLRSRVHPVSGGIGRWAQDERDDVWRLTPCLRHDASHFL